MTVAWHASSGSACQGLWKGCWDPTLLKSELCCCSIAVNRSGQLWLLIKEARALDRLGLAVPEAAVHAALQAQRMLTVEETLGDMLAEYYKVRHSTICLDGAYAAAAGRRDVICEGPGIICR